MAEQKKEIRCTFCRTYICSITIYVAMDRLKYDRTGLPTEGRKTERVFGIDNLRCPKCKKMFSEVEFVVATTGG